MKTRTLAIGMLLLAAALAPVVLAAPDAPGGGPRGQRGPEGMGRGGFGSMMGGDTAAMVLGRMGEELGLTEEQRAKIEAIREKNSTKTQELQAAVREAMQDLNEAAEAGDEAKITASGKAAGEALTKQAMQRAAVSKEVKAVLTAEQLKKLDDLRAQMRERMEQRRQQGPEGQDQPRPRRQQQGQE